MKYCRLNSSATRAVAGSMSRFETTISVRPPLSSVSARSASMFTPSPLFRLLGFDGFDDGGDVALEGGATTDVGPLPGKGCGTARVDGPDAEPDEPDEPDDPFERAGYDALPEASMPIA